jgi:hypothetical protein
MQKLYSGLATIYFLAATLALMVIGFVLLGMAILELVLLARQGNVVDGALNGVGLLIIGFAVIETSKFIAEEEILRDRELRSSTESRRSITKFITIIVIAASLEALVMVFQTSRRGIEYALYPAGLFVAAMFALLSLGAYQWLSSRIHSDNPLDGPNPPTEDTSNEKKPARRRASK